MLGVATEKQIVRRLPAARLRIIVETQSVGLVERYLDLQVQNVPLLRTSPLEQLSQLRQSLFNLRQLFFAHHGSEGRILSRDDHGPRQGEQQDDKQTRTGARQSLWRLPAWLGQYPDIISRG